MFDVSLCEQYYQMPKSYWKLAQETLAWMEKDALANVLVKAAVDAVAHLSADETAEAFANAKAYVQRTCPERQEGVYPALFACALPTSLNRLHRMGFEDAMIRESLSDYGIWARYYRESKKIDGFGEMVWEVRFITGRIVKIGRLQYEMCPFELPCTVYRCEDRIVPVMHPGMGIDANGFIATDAPEVFQTQYAVEGDCVRANRVDVRRARVLSEVVALENAVPLLTTGMPTLSLHIPETGEPLDEDSVQDSMRRAKAFFEKRSYPCELAMCESWLLDPAHQTYSSGGNICRFQARFQTLPIPTKTSDAVNRVFGRGTDLSDLDALPGNTRMRRGLIDYMKSGLPLRDAGGVIEL